MQTIKRSGIQASQKGPEQYFIGNVRVDPLFQPVEGGRVSGGLVTFEPGARSAWHTHPLGQHLVVVSGCGWTQCSGGPKKKFAQAMLFHAIAAKSIGMAQRPQRV